MFTALTPAQTIFIALWMPNFQLINQLINVPPPLYTQYGDTGPCHSGELRSLCSYPLSASIVVHAQVLLTVVLMPTYHSACGSAALSALSLASG